MNITKTKSIVKTGSQEADIKIYMQERIHGTAIFWIVVDGTKIPQCWC